MIRDAYYLTYINFFLINKLIVEFMEKKNVKKKR